MSQQYWYIDFIHLALESSHIIDIISEFTCDSPVVLQMVEEKCVDFGLHYIPDRHVILCDKNTKGLSGVTKVSPEL